MFIEVFQQIEIFPAFQMLFFFITSSPVLSLVSVLGNRYFACCTEVDLCVYRWKWVVGFLYVLAKFLICLMFLEMVNTS